MTLYLKSNGQMVPVTGGDPFPITPWTPITAFLNGWLNFGSGQQDVEYRRFGDMVQIRGHIRDGTNQSAAFNLPVGFRPLVSNNYSASNYTAADGPIPSFVIVNVAGDVIPYATSNLDVAFFFEFSVTATGQAPAFQTGEEQFAGEHVLIGDPDSPPAEWAEQQLLWDQGLGGGDSSLLGRRWYEIEQPSTFIDSFVDLNFNDDIGTFTFDTITRISITNVTMAPDRAAALGNTLFSNNIPNALGDGARFFDTGKDVNGQGDSGLTLWNTLSSQHGEWKLLANTPGPTWTMRITGVQGGATGVGYTCRALVERIKA